jgi:nucleoside-diphosphate-sugar epimerase
MKVQEVAKVSISPKSIKLFIGILILTFSWSLMIPLFAGPDEHSNFIKSAAVVRGELTGVDIPATPTMSYWSTYVDIDPKFLRPSEVDLLVGNASKARSKLGWEPKVKFAELVKRMVDADIAALH